MPTYGICFIHNFTLDYFFYNILQCDESNSLVKTDLLLLQCSLSVQMTCVTDLKDKIKTIKILHVYVNVRSCGESNVFSRVLSVQGSPYRAPAPLLTIQGPFALPTTYRNHSDMFKLVHYLAHASVCKLAVGIQLKCLLVT